MKVLDLKGFIKKYEFEPCSKAKIKSTFNILKKDDINVETILNHNIQQKEYTKFGKFINLYQSVIRKEWRAHMDELTSMTIITEPLSFATSSKDKLVKVWNFKCECIGVINVLPKLSRVDNLPEWEFKVNEKKILETEINEVVRIFEEVGVDKIEIGSKEDKELENMVFEEKVEKTEVSVRQQKPKVNKKRFKLIEKEDVVKKVHKTDEGRGNISYEGLFVQDIQKKIEGIFSNDVPRQGMNEITFNVIKKLVDNRERYNTITERCVTRTKGDK